LKAAKSWADDSDDAHADNLHAQESENCASSSKRGRSEKIVTGPRGDAAHAPRQSAKKLVEKRKTVGIKALQMILW